MSTVEMEDGTVFPAHAGMSPWSDPGSDRLPGFPRTRGDEPNQDTNHH